MRKEAEVTGKIPPEHKTESDIRKGFVYKRVPHVTLKSIANNPDIREGMTREQIDAAIARHAETETLYDQPYEDRSASASPGRSPSRACRRTACCTTRRRAAGLRARQASATPRPAHFAEMILDNLRKAGVQNTVKHERLTFTRLDPYAGRWLQASGEYTDADGKATASPSRSARSTAQSARSR